MASEARVQASWHSTSKQGRSHQNQGIVLVADPSPGLCRTLADFVAQLGYRAVAATDGGTAISLGRRFDPDLILVRENMPGMRAPDFVDAGIGNLLRRRMLIIDRRLVNRPRPLPTLSIPMECERLVQCLSDGLAQLDCR